jgi:hypothetical protein
MTTAIWIDIFVLTAWVLLLHRNIRYLTRTVAAQTELLSVMVRQQYDLIAEEIPKARAELSEALERLDIGGLRKRVDPEERRED